MMLTLMVGTGCTEKKPESTDSIIADTMLCDTLEHDSLDDIIEEQPMPKAADELFDDFIFNFAASKKVQRERTDFPLPHNMHGKVSNVSQRAWSMEHFFMRQGYYTLVFNDARQMNLVKDTSVGDAVVERITFASNEVKQWSFCRVDGLWKLQNVEIMDLDKHTDASFLKFYQQFATDSLTQMQSLNDLVHFSGPDPDDDFSRMEGELMPEQWPMFAPWMPADVIYNIHYGKDKYKPTSTRLFIIRGISNGMETELTFEKVGDKWILKKINT